MFVRPCPQCGEEMDAIYEDWEDDEGEHMELIGYICDNDHFVHESDIGWKEPDKKPEVSMTKRDIAQEIEDDLQILAQGGTLVTHVHAVTYPSPAGLRARLNLSQSEFADAIGVSVRTLQEWEQGRSVPSGPALALLRIIDRHPEVLE